MTNQLGMIKQLLLLAILLMMVGCQSAAATATPLANTPTPDATALAITPTLPPAGLPGNPVRLMIRPFSNDLRDEQEILLEEGILNESSVSVDVIQVEDTSDLLAGLCAAGDERVEAVWLDGFGYAAAAAQNCGEPVLAVQRQVDEEIADGEAGLIIVNAALGRTDLSVFQGRVFCRLGYDDLYSWLLPSIVFKQSNLEPADFGAIVDYEDISERVEAVASGDCAGAGVPESTLLALDEDVVADIEIATTTIAIPHAVLMYPIDLPSNARLSLTKGLIALSEDSDGAELMHPFLGQAELVAVNDDDFSEFRTFLEDAGLDFAQLGN